jgi:hypothetical protein
MMHRCINRPEGEICRPRAVLRGIRPLIWCRLLVLSDKRIAELHDVAQVPAEGLPATLCRSHQFIELAIDGCLDGLGCTQTLDV